MNLTRIKNRLGLSDKRMCDFLKIAPDCNLKPNGLTSIFQALVESIISQQLSVKAASCIFKRLCSLFGSQNTVRPLDIFRTSDDELRAIGISKPKTAAIRDLTDFALSNRLPTIEQLEGMSDEAIIESLTQIKGIGRWTVEMLLIFKLGRIDVMASSDQGLRKGFAIIEGIYPRLPSPQELAEHAEKHWKPYRSIASWYLWRACEAY